MSTPKNFSNPIKIKRNPNSKDKHIKSQAKKHELYDVKLKKIKRERKKDDRVRE